jgi:hypothetical protein
VASGPARVEYLERDDWRLEINTDLLTHLLLLTYFSDLPSLQFAAFVGNLDICFILCTWTSPVVEGTTSIFDGANARNRSGKLRQPQ